MGQDEVVQVLRKSKKPMSRSDIAKALNMNPILISHNIKAAIKSKSIKVMEIDRFQAMQLYHCKRRMRLYYY